MSVWSVVTRRSALRLGLAGAALPLAGGMPSRVRAEALPPVVVWKDVNCGCCEGWVRHLRDAGFSVTVRDVPDMAAIKRARNVPDSLQSCHTAVVAGYVIEGHVPAGDIKRLIAGQPSSKGLAVPGMPQSAPGMDQPGEPYKVVMFGTPTGDRIYARY
jgi:hypothetical protein